MREASGKGATNVKTSSSRPESAPARRSISTAPDAALVSRLNQANVSQIEEGSPCSQTGQVCAANGREGAASWAWRRTTFKVPTPRSGKAAEGEDGGNGGDRVKGPGEHESGRARPRSAVGRLMSKFVVGDSSRLRAAVLPLTRGKTAACQRQGSSRGVREYLLGTSAEAERVEIVPLPDDLDEELEGRGNRPRLC